MQALMTEALAITPAKDVAGRIKGLDWERVSMDIVGKQTKLLVLGEGDHMRACASSLAVIDWRSANSEP